MSSNRSALGSLSGNQFAMVNPNRLSSEKLPSTQFIMITPSSDLTVLSDLKAEDKTNLTITHRAVYNYDHQLKTDLRAQIISQSQEKKRKVKLLDAGCGQGIAINELLGAVGLKKYLDSCTGVSKHYFANIALVLGNHRERFNYGYGKVQDYLASVTNEYDVIVDVYGAFCYSTDRIKLMQLYYQALTLNSIAHICMGSYKNNVLVTDGLETKPFLQIITDKYPDIFETTTATHPNGKDDFILKITKRSEQFPLPSYRIVSFDWTCWTSPTFFNESDSPELQQLKMEEGNALAPKNVIFSLQSEPIEPTHIPLAEPEIKISPNPHFAEKVLPFPKDSRASTVANNETKTSTPLQPTSTLGTLQFSSVANVLKAIAKKSPSDPSFLPAEETCSSTPIIEKELPLPTILQNSVPYNPNAIFSHFPIQKISSPKSTRENVKETSSEISKKRGCGSGCVIS